MSSNTDFNALSDADFRKFLEDWLAANYPPEWRQDLRRPFRRLRGDDVVRWIRMQLEAGLRCPAWPKQYGGMGLDFAKQLVHQEVFEHYGVARVLDLAETQIGPTLMAHGSDAQKAAFIPPMLRGDHTWCQGYSEPGAGSDLASLKTAAVVDGDVLRVTGQKIWTSHAQEATHIFALVRTAKLEKKQQGISFILAEMNTPGITIRPIANLAGEEEFCEVFFDDAKVPLANVVGGLDNGWTVAKALLGHERVWIGSPGLATRALWVARQLMQHHAGDQGLADAYATVAADLQDLRSLYRKTCRDIAGGRQPGPEVSMLKVLQSELLQRITELNVELGGPDALIDGDSVVGNGPAAMLADYGWQFFMARPGTIFAGANEIQRNVLAKSVLGLGSK